MISNEQEHTFKHITLIISISLSRYIQNIELEKQTNKLKHTYTHAHTHTHTHKHTNHKTSLIIK